MGFGIVLAAMGGEALVAIGPRAAFLADEAVALGARGGFAAFDANLGFGFIHLLALVAPSHPHGTNVPRRWLHITTTTSPSCSALNSRATTAAKKDERPTPFRVLGTFNQTKEKSHDKALELLA
jgi:hypothetical protein